MTNNVARPIYGKTLKNLALQIKLTEGLGNLVCSIGHSSTTKNIEMTTFGLPSPFSRLCQIYEKILEH